MRLVSRRRWLTLPVVAALATIGAIAPMAPASGEEPPDDSGVIVATGNVVLNPFPVCPLLTPLCAPAGGTADLCVDGVATDENLGVHVYADGIDNPLQGPPNSCLPSGGAPSLHSNFQYDEPCVGAVGLASGSLSLAGLTDTDSSGDPTDQSEQFYWFRVGLNAVVLISDTVFPVPPNLPGTASLAAVDGVAVAAFVPVSPLPPPNCVTGAGALNVYVAAIGAWV